MNFSTTFKTLALLAVAGVLAMLSINAEAANSNKILHCLATYHLASATTNAAIFKEVQLCEASATSDHAKLACVTQAYNDHKAEVLTNLENLGTCLSNAIPQ